MPNLARRLELRYRAFRFVALLLEHPRGLEIRELMEALQVSRSGIYRMRDAARAAGLVVASTNPGGATDRTRWSIVIPARVRRSSARSHRLRA